MCKLCVPYTLYDCRLQELVVRIEERLYLELDCFVRLATSLASGNDICWVLILF